MFNTHQITTESAGAGSTQARTPIGLLTLAILSLSLLPHISDAETLSAQNLVTKQGWSSEQVLEVLQTQDQFGADDQWDNYLEFTPNRKGYQGIFSFNLPATALDNVAQLTLQANYRGPEKAFQHWFFQLLNVHSGRWITIADNNTAQDWLWSDIKTAIDQPEQYINSNGQLTLRYRTLSNQDNSQLDLLAFTLKLRDTPADTPADTPNIEPTPVSPAPYWQPTPGLNWQVQYSGVLDTQVDADVYNIDLFDTSSATISELHAQGKRVICYFSAGSYENWRPDKALFPSSVLGRNLDGWPGEKWLDIRQLAVLMPIMNARIQLAATKGCDAVDPDNADGYSNNTGFSLSYQNQLNYNRALANSAHALGLAIGLKNDVGQIKDLVTDFDFTINESCYQYNECDRLKPFIAAGKAVLGIEYSLANASFCPKANAANFDFIKKRVALDAWRESCR